MNTVWSDYVQSIGTLYLSRSLRFSDLFREKYTRAFQIDGRKRFLEIGCGPGALAQALHRWYPGAEVTGVDRDSRFIQFAAQEAPDIIFQEEDATSLSFGDASFDVAISNTVAEHIEPSAFFREQYRILADGGVCLVLSARRGIYQSAPCVAEKSDFEKEIWERVDKRCQELHKEHGVCAYPMSEAEYPAYMEKCGFQNVSTEYITINLTPDNPAYSGETAHAMIDANRQNDIDAVDSLQKIAADLVSNGEISEMKRLVNERYDKRIQLYDSGAKQWDANVSVTMILRGIKKL